LLLEEVEAPATIEYDDREFQYLGQDSDPGFHQFYRFTPGQAEVLLTSYDDDGSGESLDSVGYDRQN
jgi:hypothetical protein